jgi:putative ABC transport system permease protein
VLITLLIYTQAADATHLPLHLTYARAFWVFVLTLAMCCASAILAIRKLKSAEPAAVY